MKIPLHLDTTNITLLTNTNPIMTTSLLLIILATSLLFAWSLRNVVFLLSPGNDQQLKQLKVSKSQLTRYAHTFIIVSGIVTGIFLPAIWPVVAAVVVYGVIVNSRLSRKEKSLIQEILDQQHEVAVMSLTLGYVDNNPKDDLLKIWFIPCQSAWPLMKMETSISYLIQPIEHTQNYDLNEHFLPRLAAAIHDERAEAMFLAMKKDLLAHGVTHPIDIQGWDYHPIIRSFIERIMSAEPQENIQPEDHTQAA